jgi:hypothetical protein
LDECQEWLKKAMEIDEQTIKRVAIDNVDLKPLWDVMGGTLWKRTEQLAQSPAMSRLALMRPSA